MSLWAMQEMRRCRNGKHTSSEHSFFVIIQFNHIIIKYNSIISSLINQGGHHAKIWKKTITHSKLIDQSPKMLPGKGGRKSKRSHPEVKLVRRLFQVINIKRVVLQHPENTRLEQSLHYTNFSSWNFLQSQEASVFCKLLQQLKNFGWMPQVCYRPRICSQRPKITTQVFTWPVQDKRHSNCLLPIDW